MTSVRDRAVELYDRYTHEHRDRRQLLREVTALVGSAAAAEVLIAGIGASSAAAAVVPADDRRLRTATRTGEEAGRPLTTYHASPVKGPRRRGTVVVVHENRGLNDHIRDVARRVALEGFDAVAPDLLSPQGGTPVGDDDRARAMIGTADYDLAIAQVRGLLARAGQGGTGKAGVVGFCWGGAMVDRVAVAAGDALAAGVSYYGPAPAPSEAAKVRSPLMIHLAGKDARVNGTAEPFIAALREAGRAVEAFTYPGVDHAFNNDTAVERYNAAAAAQAWARTSGFLRRYLNG